MLAAKARLLASRWQGESKAGALLFVEDFVPKATDSGAAIPCGACWQPSLRNPCEAPYACTAVCLDMCLCKGDRLVVRWPLAVITDQLQGTSLGVMLAIARGRQCWLIFLDICKDTRGL